MKKESGNTGRKHNIPSVVCRTVSVLILAAVLGICIPMTVPRFFGYDVYTVISGSMEPEIPVGSAIYVEKVLPEEVRAGEVIAFYSRGAVITHRVVENRTVSGEFITKGDANAENDVTPGEYKSLIGRVVVSVPVLGSLMGFCSQPMGKIYLACSVAGAVLLQLAGSLFRRKQ